jgi:hypothetical protein
MAVDDGEASAVSGNMNTVGIRVPGLGAEACGKNVVQRLAQSQRVPGVITARNSHFLFDAQGFGARQGPDRQFEHVGALQDLAGGGGRGRKEKPRHERQQPSMPFARVGHRSSRQWKAVEVSRR